MIEARGLAKRFRTGRGQSVEAVRGIDLDVAEGELVALLGPNGAGKTTALRMLTTLLAPTAGTARVAGHDLVAEPAAVRRRIGHIGQGHGAGEYQRVRDELVVQGYAYGLRRAAAHRRADELLAALRLGDLARRTVSTLSGGQRRRLDVALGLVHHPPLLFLDEPSTGLDPQNRADLWQHVADLRARLGTTMVLTTHYLDEADALAERVLIVDHGRIVADDTPARLKADLAGDRVAVTVATAADAATAVEAARRLATVRDVEVDGAVVRLRAAAGDALLPAWLRALDHQGVTVRTADVDRPTLDDVFLALTGRSLREDTGAAGAPAAEVGAGDGTVAA